MAFHAVEDRGAPEDFIGYWVDGENCSRCGDPLQFASQASWTPDGKTWDSSSVPIARCPNDACPTWGLTPIGEGDPFGDAPTS